MSIKCQRLALVTICLMVISLLTGCTGKSDEVGWKHLLDYVYSDQAALDAERYPIEAIAPCTPVDLEDRGSQGALSQYIVGTEDDLQSIAVEAKERLMANGFDHVPTPSRARAEYDFEGAKKFAGRHSVALLTLSREAPDGRSVQGVPPASILWLEYQYQPERC